MEKKNPVLIVTLVMLSFAIVALLNTTFSGSNGITGYSVYGKLSSIFSGNTLSTMGAPMIILTLILVVSAVALRNISKD